MKFEGSSRGYDQGDSGDRGYIVTLIISLGVDTVAVVEAAAITYAMRQCLVVMEYFREIGYFGVINY